MQGRLVLVRVQQARPLMHRRLDRIFLPLLCPIRTMDTPGLAVQGRLVLALVLRLRARPLMHRRLNRISRRLLCLIRTTGTPGLVVQWRSVLALVLRLRPSTLRRPDRISRRLLCSIRTPDTLGLAVRRQLPLVAQALPWLLRTIGRIYFRPYSLIRTLNRPPIFLRKTE